MLLLNTNNLLYSSSSSPINITQTQTHTYNNKQPKPPKTYFVTVKFVIREPKPRCERTVRREIDENAGKGIHENARTTRRASRRDVDINDTPYGSLERIRRRGHGIPGAGYEACFLNWAISFVASRADLSSLWGIR